MVGRELVVGLSGIGLFTRQKPLLPGLEILFQVSMVKITPLN